KTGDVIDLIPGFLRFEFTTNEGAVFGMGQGMRWLFLVVSVAAVLFLIYLFLTSGRQWLYQIFLGILLAGVMGNMYDRLLLGYVRDMIHAFPAWRIFPWIFNVADSLLCVGVALIVLYSSFTRHAQAPECPPSSPNSTSTSSDGRSASR